MRGGQPREEQLWLALMGDLRAVCDGLEDAEEFHCFNLEASQECFGTI